MAKLHFYYSAMNACKSTTLLQSSYNYNELGMEWTRSYFFLRFSDSDRDGESKISTRVGLEAEACTFQTKSNLFEIISAKLKKIRTFVLF